MSSSVLTALLCLIPGKDKGTWYSDYAVQVYVDAYKVSARFFVCFLILTINLKSPFAAKELKKFWKEHSLLLPQHLSHLCPRHDWPPQAPISPVGLELLIRSSLPDSTLVPSLGPKWSVCSSIPTTSLSSVPLILRTNVQLFPRQGAAPDSPPGLALPCYPTPPLHTPRPPP